MEQLQSSQLAHGLCCRSCAVVYVVNVIIRDNGGINNYSLISSDRQDGVDLYGPGVYSLVI